MSRIIKLIANSVLKSNNQEYIFIHSNLGKDIEIAKQIGGKPLTYEEHQFDSNKIFRIINDEHLSLDLNLLPKFVINTSLIKYHNAVKLSSLLRIPIINIIYDLSHTKKEGLFSIAHQLDENINILFDEHIAMKLYLTNFNIIADITQIKDLVEKGYNQWKPE